MKVLLIENDQIIANFILNGLKEAGYCVDHTADGLEGLDFALNNGYDIDIIDITLPQLVSYWLGYKRICDVPMTSLKLQENNRFTTQRVFTFGISYGQYREYCFKSYDY